MDTLYRLCRHQWNSGSLGRMYVGRGVSSARGFCCHMVLDILHSSHDPEVLIERTPSETGQCDSVKLANQKMVYDLAEVHRSPD